MPEKTESSPQHARSRILRVIAELLVVAICGLTFGVTAQLLLVSLVRSSVSGTRDFVVYWATGQQLMHHANPYDGDALARVEESAGLPSTLGAKYMRNPPWILPLTIPLGYLRLRVASVLWSLVLLTCFFVSVHALWAMHGRPKSRRHFLAYSFAPALLCVILGQTAIFVLLGLVLFLHLHRTHPFLAGLSLWLVLVKPHLVLPFGVVLVLWIFVSRTYRVLAGVVTALAASVSVTSFFDPMAWQQYLKMVHTAGIERDYIPCLSYLLREWISPYSVWIQFLPATLGCVWGLVYFWPRRHRWDWVRDGSQLLLVSILVAPYSWLFDQVVVIPALLRGAYLTRSRNLVFALALASALIEIAFFCNAWFPSSLYLWTLWTTPVWLGWYLLAAKPAEERAREIHELSD